LKTDTSQLSGRRIFQRMALREMATATVFERLKRAVSILSLWKEPMPESLTLRWKILEIERLW